MALLRQNAAQEVAVAAPADHVYKACLKIAGKIGTVTTHTDKLHSLVMKTPLTLLPMIANPVVLRISVLPDINGSKVSFNGESPDGAIGIGSVGKVITRFEEALVQELKL